MCFVLLYFARYLGCHRPSICFLLKNSSDPSPKWSQPTFLRYQNFDVRNEFRVFQRLFKPGLRRAERVYHATHAESRRRLQHAGSSLAYIRFNAGGQPGQTRRTAPLPALSPLGPSRTGPSLAPEWNNAKYRQSEQRKKPTPRGLLRSAIIFRPFRTLEFGSLRSRMPNKRIGVMLDVL